MKAYIFEVEPTNTGFICIAEIIECNCEKQIDEYYRLNYDSDYYGYQFSNNGLTVTKQTTYKTLGNKIL